MWTSVSPYPEVTAAVRESLIAFDKQLPGYAGPTALLHAPEAGRCRLTPA